MQQHSRQRSKKGQQKTFKVNIDGHTIDMTRDQVIANGQGWKKCHGEHNGTEVHSLSIKRIGDRIFLKDQGDLSSFDYHELAVAIPEMQNLIDQSSTST